MQSIFNFIDSFLLQGHCCCKHEVASIGAVLTEDRNHPREIIILWLGYASQVGRLYKLTSG